MRPQRLVPNRFTITVCASLLLGASAGSASFSSLFDCNRLDADEPLVLSKQTPDGSKPVEENRRVREFFNMEVRAHRIIFVLDHSKSMLSQLDGETRLQRLREEMDVFFDQADGTQYFDLHCFNDRLAVYRKRLVHTDEATVRDAREFLGKQSARGKTATYDALKSALIEGQSEFADRIIFVTDGHPTVGSIVDPSQILDALRTLNRESQIPIDVLAYDTASYPDRRGFLERLAYEHKGHFVPLE